MVDSFSSAKPYSFQVDGTPFTLPGLSFGDVEDVASAFEGDIGQQMASMKKILFSRSNEATQAAIRSLGIADLGKLFKSWAGIDASEPAGSETSAENTHDNSPTTA